jgi:hypothetical protein
VPASNVKVVGGPDYIPPERTSWKPANSRDLWSAGILGYIILTRAELGFIADDQAILPLMSRAFKCKGEARKRNNGLLECVSEENYADNEYPDTVARFEEQMTKCNKREFHPMPEWTMTEAFQRKVGFGFLEPTPISPVVIHGLLKCSPGERWTAHRARTCLTYPDLRVGDGEMKGSLIGLWHDRIIKLHQHQILWAEPNAPEWKKAVDLTPSSTVENHDAGSSTRHCFKVEDRIFCVKSSEVRDQWVAAIRLRLDCFDDSKWPRLGSV